MLERRAGDGHTHPQAERVEAACAVCSWHTVACGQSLGLLGVVSRRVGVHTKQTGHQVRIATINWHNATERRHSYLASGPAEQRWRPGVRNRGHQPTGLPVLSHGGTHL